MMDDNIIKLSSFLFAGFIILCVVNKKIRYAEDDKTNNLSKYVQTSDVTVCHKYSQTDIDDDEYQILSQTTKHL